MPDPENTKTGRLNKPATGSFNPGEPVFLAVGRLGKPHGIKGEIQMVVLTDFPERLKVGLKVYLGEDHQPNKIVSVRRNNQRLLIRFAGMKDRSQVEQLRTLPVFVRTEDIPPLAAGELYLHQILGFSVEDSALGVLGFLAEVLETGANDVYIIRPDAGKDILIPAIPEVILEIDLMHRLIRVELPEGLI